MERSASKAGPSVELLAFYPALSVMVFLRRGIGLRLLPLRWIASTFAMLQLYAYFGTIFLNGTLLDFQAVELFAALFLALATLHALRAWFDVRRGVRRHSYSSGISWLENRWSLRWCRSLRRIYRINEPLFCLLLAGLLENRFALLAFWLAGSALSLRSFEQTRYLAALDRELDTGDNLAEAELQQAAAEHFARSPKLTSNQSSQPVIFAGVGADIEKQIAANRARTSQKTSDSTSSNDKQGESK